MESLKKTSAGRLDTMWRRMCYLCTRENNDGRCADGQVEQRRGDAPLRHRHIPPAQ